MFFSFRVFGGAVVLAAEDGVEAVPREFFDECVQLFLLSDSFADARVFPRRDVGGDVFSFDRPLEVVMRAFGTVSKINVEPSAKSNTWHTATITGAYMDTFRWSARGASDTGRGFFYVEVPGVLK